MPSALAEYALPWLFTASLPLSWMLAERVRNIVRYLGIYVLVQLFRNAGEMDGPLLLPEGVPAFVAERIEICCATLSALSMTEPPPFLSALRDVWIDQHVGMLELVKFVMLLPTDDDFEQKSRTSLSQTTVTNE